MFQCSRRAPGWSWFTTVVIWSGVRFGLRLLAMFLYGLRTAGEEHIPDSGPVIFAANHQSHFDPVLVGILVGDRPFTSLARESLFHPKPFGAFLRFMGSQPLKRGKGDTAAMRAALEVLEMGRTILIFPEGTRSKDGTIGEFKRGISLVALRSGAPVVPVRVDGATKIWPPSRKYPKLFGRRIRVRAGEAMSGELIKELGADGFIEQLEQRVAAIDMP